MESHRVVLSDIDYFSKCWVFYWKAKKVKQSRHVEDDPDFVCRGFAKKWSLGGVVGVFEKDGRPWLVTADRMISLCEDSLQVAGHFGRFFSVLKISCNEFEKVFFELAIERGILSILDPTWDSFDWEQGDAVSAMKNWAEYGRSIPKK